MNLVGELVIVGIVFFIIIMYGVEIGVKNALIWYEKEKRKNNLNE